MDNVSLVSETILEIIQSIMKSNCKGFYIYIDFHGSGGMGLSSLCTNTFTPFNDSTL